MTAPADDYAPGYPEPEEPCDVSPPPERVYAHSPVTAPVPVIPEAVLRYIAECPALCQHKQMIPNAIGDDVNLSDLAAYALAHVEGLRGLVAIIRPVYGDIAAMQACAETWRAIQALASRLLPEPPR